MNPQSEPSATLHKQAQEGLRGHLVFLGTGTSVGVPVVGCSCSTCLSGHPKNQRLRCSLALGLPAGTLLIDTTPDLRTQLLREHIGLVHATLYTHDHADHVFGLDDLRIFPYYLGSPMPIFCEEQVESRIRKSFDYAFVPEAKAYAGGVPQIEFQRIGLQPFEVLGQRIVPFRLWHGRFQVLGFRFGNIAYCTDTNRIPEESWPLLAGLDVLILDALRPRSHAWKKPLPWQSSLSLSERSSRIRRMRLTMRPSTRNCRRVWNSPTMACAFRSPEPRLIRHSPGGY